MVLGFRKRKEGAKLGNVGKKKLNLGGEMTKKGLIKEWESWIWANRETPTPHFSALLCSGGSSFMDTDTAKFLAAFLLRSFGHERTEIPLVMVLFTFCGGKGIDLALK